MLTKIGTDSFSENKSWQFLTYFSLLLMSGFCHTHKPYSIITDYNTVSPATQE